MSSAKLYPWFDGFMTIKDICNMKYPIGRPMTVSKLREEGLVATVQIDKVTYEYRLIEKLEMPAPKRVPLFIPQMPIYDLNGV